MRILGVLVVLAVGCKMNEKPAPSPDPQVAVPPPHAATCPGATAWAAGMRTCTDDAGCGSGERCYPDGVPDMSGVCGAPVADEIHCNVDRDCKRGMLCRPRPGRCGSQIVECVPGCTLTPCEAGMRCGSDGNCAAIACTDGYACGSGMRCGSGLYADAHGCGQVPCWEGGAACGPTAVCERDVGCAPRVCRTSADCPCGSCIDKTCRARPGVCGPAEIPVPA